MSGPHRVGEKRDSRRKGTVSRRRFLGGSLALCAGAWAGDAGLHDRRAQILTIADARGSYVGGTLRQKIGRLFVVSFRGTALEAELHRLISHDALGGVILLARNCVSGGQTRRLVAQLQSASSFPLLVCTDQEGGSVVRIRHGAPVFPPEAEYGKTGSSGLVYRDAATTARALRSLGVTVNLAPVVDVVANPHSPIGDRSYGSDPETAARLSTAAIRGYQDHGLAATAKHFVGLGRTSLDSHQTLPTVTQSLSALERSDLVPFRRAIAAGVSTVLVAHVALPAIDRVNRPASLSPAIIDGLLRRRLRFRGVIMTDSLLMGALPGGQRTEAAERAFAAGADILLMSTDRDFPTAVVEEAIDRLVAAVRRKSIAESRVDESLGRILSLQRRFPAAPLTARTPWE